ncbi:MAG: hypothetical protein ACYTHK_06275 [Planctomycetota bacterium]|jgi:hypothetical protein
MRFLILPLFLLAACGGGSDPVSVIGGLLGTAGCTANGIDGFDQVMTALESELDRVPVPQQINYDQGSGDSRLQVDAAVATLGGDLADGFDEGDTARLTVTRAALGTEITGSGILTAVFSTPTSILVTGQIGFSDDVCTANFSNVALDFDPTDPNGYPTGTVEFTTQARGDTLVGTFSFDGTSTARVNAALNGGVPVDFTVDLDSYDVDLP